MSSRRGGANTGHATGTFLIHHCTSNHFLSSDHFDKLLVETLLPLALLVTAQLVTWAHRHLRRQDKGDSRRIFGYWMSMLFLVLPGYYTPGLPSTPSIDANNLSPSLQSSRGASATAFGSPHSTTVRVVALVFWLPI